MAQRMRRMSWALQTMLIIPRLSSMARTVAELMREFDNSGLLEGTVCKFRAITRVMCGRASFKLLEIKCTKIGCQ